MKIIHIITGLENGGAEAVLQRLVSGDSGNQHIIVSLQGKGYYGEILESQGFKVYYLLMPKGFIDLRGIIKLYYIFKNEQPQIVQTWLYHADLIGGLTAYLAGMRNIFWGIHNLNLDSDKTSLKTRMAVYISSVLSGVIPKLIISCSQAAALEHSRRGYRPGKFRVIANGIDLDLFSEKASNGDQILENLKLDSYQLVLGMVARWDIQKDHSNLFRALQIVKDNCSDKWICLLAGHRMNSENLDLVNLLREFELLENVILLGVCSDVPSLMNAMDVHVLSSSGEAFGNVLVEAMACATPVITTDVGDTRLIVGDTGWIVPVKDSAQLASAIIAASLEKKRKDNWQDRKKLSRERALKLFSHTEMIESYNRVWRGKS